MHSSRHEQPPPSMIDIIEGQAAVQAGAARPWIQVWFECAGAYQKVFRSKDASRYVALCPKCGKQMKFGVGPGGSSERFFRVSC